MGILLWIVSPGHALTSLLDPGLGVEYVEES
jgi:hypothetical protein